MAKQISQTPNDHLVTNALRFIVIDVVWEFLYAPIWWYSRGTVRTIRMIRERMTNLVDLLALPILVRSLGKPMFGDYTRSGRAISFFIRIIQILVYFSITGVWAVVLGVFFLVWLAAPLVVTYQIAFQLVGPVFQ